DCKPDCFCGLEVYDQFELSRLLHRQIGGPSALENQVDEIGRAAVQAEKADAVTEQAASFRIFFGPDRGKLYPGCERRNRFEACGKLSVLRDHDRVDATLGHRCKGAIELRRALRF